MTFLNRKSYFYEKWDKNCDKDEYSISIEEYKNRKAINSIEYSFDVE